MKKKPAGLARKVRRVLSPWNLTHRAPFALYWKVRGKLSRGWRRRYAERILAGMTRRKWSAEVERLDRRLRQSRPDLLRRAPLWYWHMDYLLCRGLLGANVEVNYIRTPLYSVGWVRRCNAITQGRLWLARDLLNTPEAVALCNDKVRSAAHWREWYGRGCVEACAARPVDAARLREAMNGSPRMIVKPLDQCGGHGIYVAAVDTDAAREAAAERLNASPQPQIAEAFIEQKGLLRDMNPSSLNTVRVITGRHADGGVEVLNTYLRVGGPGAVVDNVSSGGCMFYVDPETGVVEYGKRYGRLYRTHPDSGRQITGLTLPRWQEMLEFCRVAHRHAPEGLGLAGWDVCISDDRLYLIEVNACPGFDTPGRGPIDHWKRVMALLDEWERAG